MLNRLRPRTLRSKLITGFVIAIVAVSAVIGLVTQVFLSQYLTAQLDRQVQSTAVRLGGPPPSRIGTAPDAWPGHPAGVPADLLCSNRNATGAREGRQPDDSLFAVVTTTDSATTVTAAVRGEYPSCTVVPAGTAHALTTLPADGSIHTVDLGSFGTYRVSAHRTQHGVIVSGLSTAAVNATTHRLLVILLLVAAGAVVTGGAVVWWVVRRSLRPLERVAETARQVAELPLHRGEVDLSIRVPSGVADPRTEVGQVGTALDQLLAHVDDALTSRQQSETRVRRFVADASHELRTPLTAIRGYAELAGRNPDDLPAVRHALSRVLSESTRMTRLVDDLLLLARLDAGRPVVADPVDLSQLAIDAVSDARVAGPDHRWLLELPDHPVTTLGDGQRLHQVLTNLLTNARTHTPPETIVTTTVSTEDGSAVLSVSDTGPGIPAALQPEVFERFVRGEQSRSRTAGSTGLGLAIVSAVVAAHHGSVAVASSPGNTRFTVRLPLGPGIDQP